jgi:hypothetical protein
LNCNSKVLEDFFWTKIEHHKKCWFFPDRKHLIHLQQKATLAIECFNQKMKDRLPKVVTSNMSLKESFKTQNQQVDRRMTEMKIKWIYDSKAKPTGWMANTVSSSQLTIDVLCLMQQVMEQCGNYARLISPGNKWTVEVRRINQGEIYCKVCHNEDKMFCGT